MNNAPLTYTDSYKYLGMHLSANLPWNMHINHIISNGSCSLGFIRRLLKSGPTQLKLLTFESLVQSKLEYACTIWDRPQKNLCDALEAIQNKAVCFITNDYSFMTSVSALKLTLNLEPLEHQRGIIRLALFQNFFNTALSGQSPATHAAAIFPQLNHMSKATRFICDINAFAKTFFYITAIEWNDLPSSITAIHDHSAFRDSLTRSFDP